MSRSIQAGCSLESGGESDSEIEELPDVILSMKRK